MVSPSLKVAIIRIQDGNEYFIRLGDRLGNANGTVTDIKSSSIEVTEAGEIVSVEVRNRSVNDENDE
jgi:type IV pilus assembly protein PilP